MHHRPRGAVDRTRRKANVCRRQSKSNTCRIEPPNRSPVYLATVKPFAHDQEEKQRDGGCPQGCGSACQPIARLAATQGLRAASPASLSHSAGVQAVSLPCSQAYRICLFHRDWRWLPGKHHGERRGGRGRNDRQRRHSGSAPPVRRRQGAHQRLRPGSRCGPEKSRQRCSTKNWGEALRCEW